MSLEDRITALEEDFKEYVDRQRSGDRLIFAGVLLILLAQIIQWVGS